MSARDEFLPASWGEFFHALASLALLGLLMDAAPEPESRALAALTPTGRGRAA